MKKKELNERQDGRKNGKSSYKVSIADGKMLFRISLLSTPASIALFVNVRRSLIGRGYVAIYVVPLN